jgi:hypothetical protein
MQLGEVCERIRRFDIAVQHERLGSRKLEDLIPFIGTALFAQDPTVAVALAGG